MKKDNKKPDKDDLREEYKRSDFPGGLVRGKYAKRIKESSNVIVFRPEVTQVFPNEEADIFCDGTDLDNLKIVW
ncbi:MAG: hypothetical protein ABIK92_16745 [Pseudomonadota bacterium]